jgi:hypothetical protein
VNNLEIIIENVKRNDLDRIIFEELLFDKQKIISSHFYDEHNNRDIEFEMILSLKEYFSKPRTGNIYMSEVKLGFCIHDVMIVISFDKVLGDIVVNFEESEIIKDSVTNHDCTQFVKKIQSIFKKYDIGSIIIGYEPASDNDMHLISFTKQGIKIYEENFPSILSDFKKNVYNFLS